MALSFPDVMCHLHRGRKEVLEGKTKELSLEFIKRNMAWLHLK